MPTLVGVGLFSLGILLAALMQVLAATNIVPLGDLWGLFGLSVCVLVISLGCFATLDFATAYPPVEGKLAEVNVDCGGDAQCFEDVWTSTLTHADNAYVGVSYDDLAVPLDITGSLDDPGTRRMEVHRTVIEGSGLEPYVTEWVQPSMPKGSFPAATGFTTIVVANLDGLDLDRLLEIKTSNPAQVVDVNWAFQQHYAAVTMYAT